MDAKCLVLLTRISVGSLHLTDPVDRAALASTIRAARRAQEDSWKLHGYPRTFRIFS
jgi:hypothetical protein